MKTIFGSRREHYLTRLSVFLIMAALIAGLAGCDGHTPSQNLRIRTWYDLDAVRGNLSASYTLTNDLDSTTPGYEELAGPMANEGKGWEPIGTILVNPYVLRSFVGTFDGQGYEIRDLFINRLGEEYVGLFGIVDEGGQVEDISLVNATVTGYRLVGGLAGANVGAVRDSYASSSVTGFESVGRLIGHNGGTVSNSYSSGNVTGASASRFVGGLMGANVGTVSNSYSSGNVTGEPGVSWVGGLTGFNAGTVTSSYSGDNVNGWRYVGGLVGFNDYGGNVSDCYSTGSVTGIVDVGGLVGLNAEEGIVSNCYCSGNVTGDANVGGNVGGLVGENAGTVSDSFWDTQTSGQSDSAGGTGKATAQMKNIGTFSGAGWNITAVASLGARNPSYIWNIVNEVSYPVLSWQP